MNCLMCGHNKIHHIEDKYMCAGGFKCNKDCKKFRSLNDKNIYEEVQELEEKIDDLENIIKTKDRINEFSKKEIEKLEKISLISTKKLKELNQFEIVKEIKEILK